MPARYLDWWKEAQADLRHAEHSLKDGDYNWACFASQQAAEKAAKAVYQKLGAEAWGHAVSELLAELPQPHQASDELIAKAKELDRHYIAPRYPNSHPAGPASQYYTQVDAERAIAYAKAILTFCEGHLL